MTRVRLFKISIIIILVGFFAFFFIVSTLNNNICASLYDYQSVATFSGNFSSLGYNVTVINQSDSFGNGPAYFLNGLTNKGYWYQIGIGYNWSKYGLLHYPGFSIVSYLEFVTPTIAMPVGSNIHSGDKVLLRMNFSNSNVILSIYDWNTSFSNAIILPSYNATYFVGGPYANGRHNGTANYQGHYTGLLTELQTPEIYTKMQQEITYTPFAMQYNSIQLLVINSGQLFGRTSDNFSGNLFSFVCHLDIYNIDKVFNPLSQTSASGIIEVNNYTEYNFSPFENITIQVKGMKVITK